MSVRSRQAEQAFSWSFVLVNTLFIGASLAVGVWALYPVYRSGPFVVMCAVAIAVGAAIAIVGARLRWRARRVAGVSLAFYALAGIPLAMPQQVSDAGTLGRALVELARAPITGWRDIVTLPLPLGTYQATLAPAFALVVVATVTALSLALRARSSWAIAGAIVTVLPVIAVALGPSARSQEWAGGILATFINREFALGLAALFTCLAWMVWRHHDARRRAIRRAFGDSGVRLQASSRAKAANTSLAAAVTLTAALVVAVAIASPLAAQSPRDVLRTAVEPRLEVDSAISPLSTYRLFFRNSQYDEVLFTTTVSQGSPERIRIASLTHYDGETFSAAAIGAPAGERFSRVPSLRERDSALDDRTEVTFDIESWRGMWTPTVGELTAITFDGPRRLTLVDGFYYLDAADQGVMIAEGGLDVGDVYTVSGRTPGSALDLAGIGEAPGVSSIDSSLVPESLSLWLERQGVTADGAGLATAVDRLRMRGYLSHALEPLANGEPFAWQAALGDHGFVPSTAGHSFDRIETMFEELNAREDEFGAGGENSLVAAVGNDEQFAVATAMIASELGFPSRVVIGARLVDTDHLGLAPAPCEGGICRGQNISVWTEVQSVQGLWVPVDVTPQAELPLAQRLTTQQDPQFPTEPDTVRADSVVPPSSQRGEVDAQEAEETVETVQSQWWGLVIRIMAITVAGFVVLLGPVIAVLLWKSLRMRSRRHGTPMDMIHGGWDEYVDAALDAGKPVPGHETRVELARVYATSGAEQLAHLTDRATFAHQDLDRETAQRFWDLVAQERHALTADESWWRRVRARVSLRSLWGARAVQSRERKKQRRRQGWRSGATVTTPYASQRGATTRRRLKTVSKVRTK